MPTKKKTPGKNPSTKPAAKRPAAKKAAPRKSAARKSPGTDAFGETFDGLSRILLRHAKRPLAPARTDDQLLVKGPIVPKWGKELWFGAVRRGKAYVSFHLMTLHVFPALLQSIGPDLMKRMQGKTCFNFRKPEPELFAQLDALTARCIDTLRKEGVLPAR